MPKHALFLVLTLMLSMCRAPVGMSEDGVNWQVGMASLWGKNGDQSLNAVVVNKAGLVICGGNGGQAVAAPIVSQVGNGGDGVVMVYDPDLGAIVSLTLFPGSVSDLVLTPDDGVIVSAGGQIYAMDDQVSAVLWQSSGGSRIASDGKGGVWASAKKSVQHIDATGKQTVSFSTGTGWGNTDVAYDPKTDHVFVGGSRSARGPKSGNPVHIPWIFAYNSGGKHVWTAYNFSGKDIEAAGDMADSHIQRLHVNAQGQLFFTGDAEGGNTPYRHDTLKVGGKTKANDGTPFSGEMWKAFRSVRVLYVGRLDAATGALERGSFFYGKFWNTEQDREEIGDADVYGLHADDAGRVYLSGVIRCQPRWTGNAVHKQAGPAEIVGRWKNKVGPDEAFLGIFSPDFSTLEFCSGFAQGASTRYASRAHAVGGNGTVAAVAGWSRQPKDFAEGEVAQETTYLRAPMQAAYGGGKDGYVAVLGAAATQPPLPHALVPALLTRRFPEPTALITESVKAAVFAPVLSKLQQGSDDDKKAAELILAIGRNSLQRAQDMAQTEPLTALQWLENIAKHWADVESGTTAQQAAIELKADPEFQARLKASELKQDALDLQAKLREVKEAQSSSYADPAYNRRNGSTIRRIAKIYTKLEKEYPGSAEALSVKALLVSMDMPLSDEEETLFNHLQTARRAAQVIQVRRGMEPVFKNKDFYKLNRRNLDAIQAAVKTLVAANADHTYTRYGKEVAAAFKIPLK